MENWAFSVFHDILQIVTIFSKFEFSKLSFLHFKILQIQILQISIWILQIAR